MKVFFRLSVLLLALFIALAGCNSDPVVKLDVPKSGYADRFAPVVSAQLYVDGVAQPIEPDDPRLLQVLNFLGYSAETMQSVYTQGVLTKEEVEVCYASGATMLEVTFASDPKDRTDFHYSPKILVCCDSFLLFMRDGETAEWHRPYAQNLSEEALKNPKWGTAAWIDILDYFGF